ncbi:hypothetical protein ACGFRB_06180 [Streptomyces sp. NPDC048718]|uniref:hypothetical protein n=1 Tax=Streptomyces sp. NPDC048718 TaxID=3365587 RepID=UPI0037109B95
MTRIPLSGRRVRPGTALTLAMPLLLAPLATGCGIQKSDVVEAGGAATVTVQPTTGARAILFFVGRDGRLLPVARTYSFPRPGATKEAGVIGGAGGDVAPDTEYDYVIGVDKVLSILLSGPDERERAAGLTSRIDLEGKPQAYARPMPGPDGTSVYTVHFATRVRDLDPLAVRQVICTVAYGASPDGSAAVTIAGTDGTLPTSHCEPD